MRVCRSLFVLGFVVVRRKRGKLRRGKAAYGIVEGGEGGLCAVRKEIKGRHDLLLRRGDYVGGIAKERAQRVEEHIC